jgi:arabinogalactan endo-1,4-beta-galactosidase
MQNGFFQDVPMIWRKVHTLWLTASALIFQCVVLPIPLAAAESHPKNFVLGADVSALAAPGRGGRTNRVYQENGKTNEEWAILLNHGWTLFRLRVFVAPVRDAPDNSLDNMLPLAKRIKAAGGSLLLCLHLSDTWADPGRQDIPVAWRSLNFDALEKQVEAHCHEVVGQLKAAGAMPDWVQVGNEITGGTLWPLAQLKFSTGANAQQSSEAKQWEHLTRVLKAGIRGVKTAAGDTPPRIAIHIDKGGNWQATKWFFDQITEAKVEYDIIAQSFYPPWGHGTLEQLWENMTESTKRYNKDFAIVETGYGRSRTEGAGASMKWPSSPEGRLQFMTDLINTVKKAPRGIAVLYWAPERDLWNDDGSPGPAVFVRDYLTTLTNRPASHAPTAVHP